MNEQILARGERQLTTRASNIKGVFYTVLKACYFFWPFWCIISTTCWLLKSIFDIWNLRCVLWSPPLTSDLWACTPKCSTAVSRVSGCIAEHGCLGAAKCPLVAREILFFDMWGLDFVKQLFVAPAFALSNVNQIINMSTFLNFRLSSCVFVPVLFTDSPALDLSFHCVVLGRENNLYLSNHKTNQQ